MSQGKKEGFYVFITSLGLAVKLQSMLIYTVVDNITLLTNFNSKYKCKLALILIIYSQNSSSVPAKGERMSSLLQI